MVQKRVQAGDQVYRLIIMDYKMPILKGNESALMIKKYMREDAPDQTLPLIICLTNFYDNLKKKLQ